MMKPVVMLKSTSQVFQEALDEAKKIASSEKNILLLGDTGTGKELFAQFIHDHSGHKDSPFCAVNIAGYNNNLFESELFGHEDGAFTGAKGKKDGALAEAKDGTLFLDEIGNLPLPLQTKLLRVVEYRQFRSVGGTKDTAFKARLISATNKDLESMIQEGTFLEDLYHRFNITIDIPSLSERREDIPEYVKHFLELEKEESATPVPDWFSEMHIQLVADSLATQNYYWPGNVRRLKNVVGEIYELCVRDCQEIEFETGVAKIIRKRCSDGQGQSFKVAQGLTGFVYDYLINYTENDRPLRVVVDELLIEAIGAGIDMAFVNRKNVPRHKKQIGKMLGIPNLINGSRSDLPQDKNGHDYILAALRSLNPNEDKYPDKLKEILHRC